MKKVVLGLFLGSGLILSVAYAQEECDELVNLCEKYLAPSKESNHVYVSDGQVYKALIVEEEEAEFYATFYGGSTYRIAASAGSKENYVIFDVKDMQGNVLFTNADYANEPYWDFNVESTLDVSIALRMDQDKDKESGCVTMLIAFRQ